MENRHALAVWLDEHPEITQVKFAADADCSESHLSLVLQRKRGVSMRLAKKLSVLTGGEVSVEEFLLDEQPEVAQ